MSVLVSVRSEIAPLELIVTSAPGRELDHMVPENLERYRPGVDGRPVANPDYLLFDDLVLTSAMQSEHRQLVAVLEAVTEPGQHVDFRWLLASALSEDAARAEVIDGALALEAELYGVDGARCAESRRGLSSLGATRLASALITGVDPHGGRQLLRWPAPNVLFARDLAVVAGDAFVLTYAAEPARRRDMLLMRAVLRHHPLLRDHPRLDIGEDGPVYPESGQAATIEGGDVQILSDRVVLIGVGLRTTIEGVRRLAPRLFAQGFEAVLACEMPRRRAAMHIDTLFTRIDEERCLIYPPLVTAAGSQGIRNHRFTCDGAIEEVGPSLLDELAALGVELQPVFCGGDDPVTQAREQWSDGANAFAVAPGVIICYGRNERTLRELSAVGYEIVEPAWFVRNAMRYVRRPDGVTGRVAVALDGHELVRGRGGPRCLTLPLRRG